jgi:hypothetical protein
MCQGQGGALTIVYHRDRGLLEEPDSCDVARCRSGRCSAGDGSPGLSRGFSNSAKGRFATVARGRNNLARGLGSFAAGIGAQAQSDGDFTWSDASSLAVFASAGAGEFATRSTGGVRFVTAIDGTGAPTAGVSLAADSSAWSSLATATSKRTSSRWMAAKWCGSWRRFQCRRGTTRHKIRQYVISGRWRRISRRPSRLARLTGTSRLWIPRA